MNDSVQAYQANREALLAEIVRALSADERFLAAWLGGSFGRDEADAFSDLDLAVVVSDPYSQTLCARLEETGPQPTEERLALFSKFGQPAVIYENNHNAPDGGTSTSVLYRPSAVMVDWVLIPFAKARRPAQTRLLFARVDLPLEAAPGAESLTQRARIASDRVAFFWMMAAVTAKYILRRDGVFVACWLEELQRMVGEVERLVAGEAQGYRQGSRSQLVPDPEGQAQALHQLCERMLALMPEVAQLGGQVPPSPVPAIETLLQMRHAREAGLPAWEDPSDA